MVKRKLETDPGGIILGVASFIFFLSLTKGAFVGVQLGVYSSDHPEPDHVIEMVKMMEADQVRLYDPDPCILNSFASYNNIEVVVGISNSLLGRMASSREIAAQWVEQTILPYVPKTNITAIIVGEEEEEVFSTSSSYAIISSTVPALVQCMQHIHDALVQSNLENQIKVSTLVSTSVIARGCLPSASTYFSQYASNSTSFILPLLDFLSSTGSYLMLTIPFELDAAAYRQPRGTRDDVIYSAFQALAALDFSKLLIVMVKNPQTSRLMNSGMPTINTYLYDLPVKAQKLQLISSQKLEALDSTSNNIESARERRQLLDGDKSSNILMHDSLNGNGSSNSSGTSQSWCVAKPGTPDSQLSTALNWVCASPTVGCAPIQQNGACFNPNTYASHCSYAFNLYYQNNGKISGSCDFGGTAMIVYSDPSYPGCSYPSSGSTNVNPATPGPNGSSPGGTNYSGGSSPMGSFPAGSGSNSPYNSSTKLFMCTNFVRTAALLVFSHLIFCSSKAAVGLCFI